MRESTSKKPLMARGVLTVAMMSLLALPLAAQGQAPSAHNSRLVGLDDLQARSAYQPIIQQQDGRFIAYIGHHAGPRDPVTGDRLPVFNPLTNKLEQNGVSIVDVTDPANPVYLHHLVPTGDTSGSQMVQTCLGDDLPGGGAGRVYLLRANGSVSQEVWDVTDPSAPTFVSTAVFEAGARATHKNWWDCTTGIAYIVYDARQRGWRDRRILWVVDLADPANPRFIRNFGLVGQEPGSGKGRNPPPAPAGVHEATVSPDGNRLYLAYGTGSRGVLQIVDIATLLSCDPGCTDKPKAEDLLAPQIGRLDMPSFWGGHTAFPVIGIDVKEHENWPDDGSPADFVVLVTESLRNECGTSDRRENKPHMAFMVDVTDPTKPYSVANYQVPESEGDFCARGGRFGAHAMNWSFNPNFYKKLIVVSYFNAGARIVDIRDPFHPVEAAFFIPATTALTDERCVRNGGVETCKIAIQTNNVEIDSRNFIYLADRANTGLHIIELTGDAKQILDSD